MNYQRLIITFLLLNFPTFFSHALDIDSIGIKIKESGIYVLHRVDARETLYALSHRYGTSEESIVDNNNIIGNSLSVGMVLQIPWQHGLMHAVQAGETLYSISRLYQVPIEQVKQLNDLSSDELKIGMSLNILLPAESIQAIQSNYSNEEKIAVREVKIEVSEEKKEVRSEDIVPVKENGIAAVIDGTSDTKKYLALHRTAPVGTIMRVRNEMTNLSVFVRVVGKLPDTGTNNNLLIRLSKAAQEALGALDDKFRVELSYIPNQ